MKTETRGKILVVDDEFYERRSTAEILRLAGFEVGEAANGIEALKALKEEQYEAMLLDLKMPGMSGEEVLRRLPEVDTEVQVVLLTGHGSIESAILALRQGAVDYLRKPASPEEITEALSKAVSRYRERKRQRELLNALDNSLRELKRVAGAEEESTDTSSTSAPKQNNLSVDWERRIVRWGDTEIYLTPAESRLLNVLWDAHGKVISHRELVRLVQGYEADPWEAPEITRPLVSRLRAKLAKIPGGEKWIINVRGTGYVLEIPKGKE